MDMTGSKTPTELGWGKGSENFRFILSKGVYNLVPKVIENIHKQYKKSTQIYQAFITEKYPVIIKREIFEKNRQILASDI